MQILPVNKQSISTAVQVLKNGGVIVFPTETSYGMGCDFTNSEAVNRIYKIKGRSRKKAMPVIVDSLTRAKKYAQFSKKALQLAKEHWPGALTLVLLLVKGKLEDVASSDQTIAIRVSSNKVAAALAKGIKKPLVATSANKSGDSAAYSAKAVFKQFKNKKYQPDLILDAGAVPGKKPSTIVLVLDDEVKILRQGGLKIKQ